MSGKKPEKPEKSERQGKQEQQSWDNVRHTATKTELQASQDPMIQDLISKSQNFDPALIVQQGDLIGRVFRLPEGKTVVGRHPSAQIQIHQRAVSGNHAEIRRLGNTIVIEDLKSMNGSFINGTRISSPVTLRAGDLIKIGASVFRFAERESETALTESLHDQMTRDGLTGVFNRSYLTKALNAAIEVARTGYPLCLVMIDLDFFKKINDTHGHVAGDFVLAETCRLLMESVVRTDDVLGRYGGEEFMLIMSEASLESALQVAERIRSTIEGHLYHFESKRISVTASLGVAQWKPKFKSAETFIQAADECLYRSKSSGRNRVSSIQ